MSNNWDTYFMNLAKAVGENSKCESRHIGSIIVRDKRVISTGYNGPPSGIDKCWKRFGYGHSVCPRRAMGFSSSEGIEHCVAAHSEVNAIVTAARTGVSVEGATLYCHCGPPCKACAAYIINSGIKEVVCLDKPEYQKEISSTKLMRDARLKVRKI